jgi:hypothetical protein
MAHSVITMQDTISLGCFEKGHRVALVADAIESIDQVKGRETLDELCRAERV